MSAWWCLRHVLSDIWTAECVITVFGVPLCTGLFEARGPYDTEEAAKSAANTINKEPA